MSAAHSGGAKTSAQQVICPQCGRSEGVEKVSTLYLAGIKKAGASSQPGEDLASQVLARLPDLTPQDLHALSRELAPPSSGKAAPTRPVHPALEVLVFSLVIPIFIIGILNQQRAALIPVLVVLALAYGLYFYRRKDILAKFAKAQAEQKAKQARIEHGVKNWMKLYYCTQDEVVFFPGKKESVPVEEMLNYLFERV